MQRRLLISCLCTLGLLSGCQSIPASLDQADPGIRADDHLIRPSGLGQFPVAIILHTIEGVTDAERDWAQRLANQGIAGLVIKSFPALAEAKQAENLPERVAHIRQTIDYLHHQSWVDPERIVLLGRAHGAEAALTLLAEPRATEDKRGIRAIIAYNLNCTQELAHSLDADIPVLFQLGKEDSTPAHRACVDLARTQKAAGRPVQWALYDGPGNEIDVKGHPNAHNAWQDTLQFLIHALR